MKLLQSNLNATQAALIVSCASLVTPTYAYDVRTHAAMTSAAWANSSLGSAAFQQHYGLLNYPGSIGNQYLDLTNPPTARVAHRFENVIVSDLAPRSPLPDLTLIEGWVVRGAIREDDNVLEVPDSDEPGGIFSRVLGHFYDPYNNRGLDITGLHSEPRAVDWALVPTANVYDVKTQLTPRSNRYGISNAREAMWRALTMTTADGNGGFVAAPSPSGFSNTSEDVRNAYWATVFRAIGDSVHLLQDMAQPQHTRNDPHGLRSISRTPELGALG